MSEHERPVTLALVGACLLSALIAMAPRWLEPRRSLPLELPAVRASIEGAVERPGVYELPWGARVAELVEAAGGYLPGAARNLVALADPLTDGEVVQVPGVVAAGGRRRVRLNQASIEELMSLPGIGPALAQRIIAGRPFASLEELLSVNGVGAKTLERLRPLVGL